MKGDDRMDQNQMEDNKRKNIPKGEKQVMNTLRFLSVMVITIYLVVLLFGVVQSDDFWFTLIIVGTITISFTLPFLTFPFIILWIYSLIVSLTKFSSFKQFPLNLQILFYLQILDIILAVVVIILASRPAFNCDAEIMEKHYEKNANEMRRIIHETRESLPDSSRLRIEFKDGALKTDTKLLTDIQLKELENRLEKVGCIGIYINNTDNSGYAELSFRRIGMGLYTFGLYDHSLSKGRQDSINNGGMDNFIVFNDSTVFIYGGGAFGSQSFPNKKKYLDKKRKLK